MDAQDTAERQGTLARAKTHISTRERRDLPGRPVGVIARRELDEEIGSLADLLDRRLDRDGSYGQKVLLRYDGQDVKTLPAAMGMCTVVRGDGFLAADLVLGEHTLVDLNAIESGSVEVTYDTISFRHVDGRLIEIVSLPAPRTIQ